MIAALWAPFFRHFEMFGRFSRQTFDRFQYFMFWFSLMLGINIFAVHHCWTFQPTYFFRAKFDLKFIQPNFKAFWSGSFRTKRRQQGCCECVCECVFVSEWESKRKEFRNKIGSIQHKVQRCCKQYKGWNCYVTSSPHLFHPSPTQPSHICLLQTPGKLV